MDITDCQKRVEIGKNYKNNYFRFQIVREKINLLIIILFLLE